MAVAGSRVRFVGVGVKSRERGVNGWSHVPSEMRKTSSKGGGSFQRVRHVPRRVLYGV